MVGRSSWSIELLFNEVRRASSENFARRLSNLAMGHGAANSYNVEDFGEHPWLCTLRSKLRRVERGPEEMFNK